MNKQKLTLLLILSLAVLTLGLRLWKLGEIPAGMTWDEAAIGYNGFAIWETKRDEWLQLLPISFKSFGDFKAPLAMYLSGLFTTVLAMKLWVVRLPFALIGSSSVLGIGILVYQFLSATKLKIALLKNNSTLILAIITAGLVALSPWHLHFTRAGFESGLALSIIIWATVAFNYFITTWRSVKHLPWWQPAHLSVVSSAGVSVLLFVASLYTYHSAKVAVPLLLLSLLFFWRRYVTKSMFIAGVITLTLVLGGELTSVWTGLQTQLGLLGLHPILAYWSVVLAVVGITKLSYLTTNTKHRTAVLAVLLVLGGTMLSLPLLRDGLVGSGAERFNQTSILSKDWPVTEKLSLTLENTLLHLSPEFVAMGATTTYRHGTGAWGVLLPTSAFAFYFGLLICLLVLVNPHLQKKHPQLSPSLIILSTGWLLAGILPAAIGLEIPHSNRALVALPGFILVGLIGAVSAINWLSVWKINHTISGSHQEKNLVVKSVVGMWFLLHALFFLAYWHNYTTVYPTTAADDFKYGYLEALQIAKEYRTGKRGDHTIDTVVISSQYGQPYIYTLFVNQLDPISYQGGGLANHLFVDQIRESDLNRTNTVIVATTQDQVPFDQADHLVTTDDGEVRFAVYVR